MGLGIWQHYLFREGNRILLEPYRISRARYIPPLLQQGFGHYFPTMQGSVTCRPAHLPPVQVVLDHGSLCDRE